MNVKLIKTGETKAVNPSYGARLIEQDKAVIAESVRKLAKREAAKADAGHGA